MAKVKSTIVSIIQKNKPAYGPAAVFFPVGDFPANAEGKICMNDDNNPAFPRVTSITFCKHAYGSGAAYNKPCYAVSFENNPQVIIIDADDVSQVGIFKGEADDSGNPPVLPEE